MREKADEPALAKPVRSLLWKLGAAERARDAAAARAAQAETTVREMKNTVREWRSRAEKAEAELTRIRELVAKLSRELGKPAPRGGRS